MTKFSILLVCLSIGALCQADVILEVKGLDDQNSTATGTTCAATTCPVGTTCEEVLCKKPPCNARCVPANNGNQGNCSEHEIWASCGSCEPTCANKQPICTMDCKPSRCQCAQGFFRLGEKCVTENDCDSHASNSTEPQTGGLDPIPLGCDNMLCAVGTVCVEKQVQCIRAPCPPVATCVPSNETESVPSCATVDCRDRLVCVLKEVTCVKAPCHPQPACVPQNETCTGENEEHKACGACDSTCDGPRPCPMICKLEGSCGCKLGFVRHEGKCIAQSECPAKNITKTCKTNEEFLECGTGCEPKCGDKEPRVCNKMCVANVCQCKNGFARNAAGECVVKDECSKTPSIPNNPCMTMKCSKGFKCEVEQIMCLVAPCPPARGRCVPDSEQNNCTGENEEFKQCGACDQACGKPDRMCKLNCDLGGGCGCKTGYRRNAQGKCVLPAQCETKAENGTCYAENEEWKTCGACDNKCNKPKIMCKLSCDFGGACGCKEGFVRNADDLCVLESECPGNNTECGPFETFNPCGSHCEPSCENQNPICTKDCRPGACVCEQGYARSSKGNCIPVEQCRHQNDNGYSTTCGDNEVLAECGNQCEPKCGDDEPKMCPAICNPPACACKQGFYRNANGQCVEKEACSSGKLTCANFRCGFGTTCVMKPVQCIRAPCPEHPQCVASGKTCAETTCPKGQKCVDVQCFAPPCNAICEPENPTEHNCTENELFTECGTACEPSCENPEPKMCTMQCIVNVCQCKPGFVRKGGKTGTCVPKDQCGKADNSTQCGQNEYFNQCGGCEATCENREPMCPEICRTPGQCRCEVGFARLNGSCVPFDKCLASNGTKGNETCGINEEFQECGGCEGTCENQQPMCIQACPGGPRCKCKSGFIRHGGVCVDPLLCPIHDFPAINSTLNSSSHVCKTKFEKWVDCMSCEGTCENPDPVCTEQCRPAGCQCPLPHYVRGPYGKCIPKSACKQRLDWYHNVKKNHPHKCHPNEEFKECGTQCEPTCDEPETELCVDSCKNNVCQCKYGYVRNSDGDCIKQEECALSENITCANVDCIVGSRCIMESLRCLVPPCPERPICVDIETGNDTIISQCANKTCPANTTCQEVQCFAPPCEAQCVTLDEVEHFPDDFTCANIDCQDGMMCIMKSVRCLKAPCQEIPKCVPMEGGNDTIPAACSTMLCAANTICKDFKGIAKCMSIESGNEHILASCATMLCATNTICKDVNGSAKCVPIEAGNEPIPAECATMLCAANSICKNVDGKGKCVPIAKDVNTTPKDCANMAVNPNTTICEVRNGTCVCHENDLPTVPAACALVDCIPNTVCKVINGTAKCLTDEQLKESKDPLVNPCVLKKCPSGVTCQIKNGVGIC